MRSYSKKTRIAVVAGLFLALLFGAWVWVWAGYTTSAGTVTISADTSTAGGGSGAWTTLPDMFFREAYSNDVGGNITMTLPSGYEFNTAAAVTATLIQGHNNPSKNINSEAVGGTFTLNKTATTLTIPVTSLSVTGNNANWIRWRGVQVRPTVTAPLGMSDIMLTVRLPLHPTDDGVMATLNLVAGASKLYTAWPGQVFTDGSGVTGASSGVSAGTPFDLTLYAADDSDNLATSYTGTKTVSFSGPASCYGTPVYTTSANFVGGVATVSTTLVLAAPTTVTTTLGTLTSVPSSSLIVSPGTSVQMLTTLPGQSFTSCAGNSGTPSDQTAGIAFPVEIRAVDSHFNVVGTVSGNRDMSYAGPSGTNSYTTSVNFSAGAGTGSVTINSAQTTTLSATNTSDAFPGAASSSFTVKPNSAVRFDGFDTTTPVSNTPTGTIKTKVAGLNVLFDIVALNADGTLNTGFTGTVQVQVVDANTPGSCADWTAIATLNETFTVANAGRRRTSTPLNFTNVYRNAALRVTNSMTSPATISCSSDRFAIRPSRFTVAVTDGTWETEGTARNLVINFPAVPTTNSVITHKAGRPFRIRATAVGETGALPMLNYSNAPALSLSRCSAGGVACPVTVGSATAGAWTSSGGVALTTTASVSEVGNFMMLLQDTTFSAVDALDGSTPAQRYISTSVNLGRFVPDHFAVSGATIANRVGAACAPASTFTYMNEAFQANFTLTARNATGGTTANYSGAFAADGSTLVKHNPASASFFNFGAVDGATALVAPITNVTNANPARVTTGLPHRLITGSQVYLSGIGGMAQVIVAGMPTGIPVNDSNFTVNVINANTFELVGANTTQNTAFVGGGSASRLRVTNLAGAWSNGVLPVAATLQLNRRSDADGPFNTMNIGILPIDADAVTPAAFNLNADLDVASTNERVRLGVTSVRFGRLALRPAYGTHLLDLSVPAELQQFNGVGFEVNPNDSCTRLAVANYALDGWTGGLSDTNLPQSHLPPEVAFVNGVGGIVVQRPAPTPSAKGSARLAIDLLGANRQYLLGNWADTTFTASPSSLITFGNYRATPVIYAREVF